jgi:arylsulfatase A-like enzyme
MLSSSRRSFLKLAAAAPLASPSIFNGNAQPNIIVLMADDVSARELGCYGHRQHYTPILDGLARDGCKFRTCWATPLCRPTRAELFTGRYASAPAGTTTSCGRSWVTPISISPPAI